MNYEDNTYGQKLGKCDDTHLRYDGAFMVARCFYLEMMKRNLRKELLLQDEIQNIS